MKTHIQLAALFMKFWAIFKDVNETDPSGNTEPESSRVIDYSCCSAFVGIK